MKLYILKKLIKNKTLMKYLIALSIYNYLSMNYQFMLLIQLLKIKFFQPINNEMTKEELNPNRLYQLSNDNRNIAKT